MGYSLYLRKFTFIGKDWRMDLSLIMVPFVSATGQDLNRGLYK